MRFDDHARNGNGKEGTEMKNRKRLAALILCAAYILVLFVSASYLVHEAGHHCTDDDCTVCRTIAMATELLRAFGVLVLVFAAASAAAVCRYIRRHRNGAALPVCGTLVSWKIRLND